MMNYYTYLSTFKKPIDANKSPFRRSASLSDKSPNNDKRDKSSEKILTDNSAIQNDSHRLRRSNSYSRHNSARLIDPNEKPLHTIARTKVPLNKPEDLMMRNNRRRKMRILKRTNSLHLPKTSQ